MEYEAIILDTETTNVDAPEVLELAWRSSHFETKESPQGRAAFLASEGFTMSGHARFLPTGEISLGALATHHILREDLLGYPSSTCAPAAIPSASFWIGHNVDFDWRALGSPSSIRRICTLAMSRAIWPRLDAHNLTAMTYFLEGATPAAREKVRAAHGAEADVGLCASILQRIVADEGITTFSELYAFSEECRIPKIMSFGKYKGELISAVDRGWANWYQRQADTDSYLLAALRRARKI